MSKSPRRPDLDGPSEATPSYEVGYRRPPIESRFKPGQSGNPKGRPKRHRNVRTVVQETLNQRITIREGKRTRLLSKLEGVVLAVVNSALQGNAKSVTALMALLRAVGMTAEMPEPTNTEPVTQHDREIIDEFLRRRVSGGEQAEALEITDNTQSAPPTGKTKR